MNGGRCVKYDTKTFLYDFKQMIRKLYIRKILETEASNRWIYQSSKIDSSPLSQSKKGESKIELPNSPSSNIHLRVIKIVLNFILTNYGIYITGYSCKTAQSAHNMQKYMEYSKYSNYCNI